MVSFCVSVSSDGLGLDYLCSAVVCTTYILSVPSGVSSIIDSHDPESEESAPLELSFFELLLFPLFLQFFHFLGLGCSRGLPC